LVPEIIAWEAISLSRENVDEANGNYIDGGLITKMKKPLLICPLALRGVSCAIIFI
jgi:hypothetical protein